MTLSPGYNRTCRSTSTSGYSPTLAQLPSDWPFYRSKDVSAAGFYQGRRGHLQICCSAVSRTQVRQVFAWAGVRLHFYRPKDGRRSRPKAAPPDKACNGYAKTPTSARVSGSGYGGFVHSAYPTPTLSGTHHKSERKFLETNGF